MKKTVIILIALLALISCRSTIQKYIYPTLGDGKYDSEFPYRNSSEQLEAITKSVKMINCMAFYVSYQFNKNSNLKLDNIGNVNFKERAINSTYYTNTASGTSTIINNEEGKIVLLTSAHIVNFADTIITYFKDYDGKFTNQIESISIKERQTNYIPDFPLPGDVDILLVDKILDVALLGKNYGKANADKFDLFPYTAGSALELDWGTFVYAIGFPMNYKMITKAIVSSPNRDNNGSFLIDAVFNRGFSGGIVLAIRDGVPNFELVGLVNTVPAVSEYIVTPDAKENEWNYNPTVPYTNNLYVKQSSNIRYGITKVTPIDLILKFIEKNQRLLENKGFYIDKFLKK